MSTRSRQRRSANVRKAASPRIESLESRQLLSGDPVGVVPAVDTAANVSDPDVSLSSDAGAADSSTNQLDSTDDTPADDSAVVDTSTQDDQSIQTLASNSAPVETGTVDLVSASFATPGNLDWDETFRATGMIKNAGTTATTEPFEVQVFATPELLSTANAVSVGSFVVPAGIAPGQSYAFDEVFMTPGRPNAALASRASYYMRLALDTNDSVAESDETNNLSAGLQGVDAAVVTVTPRLPAKLVPAGLAVSSGVLEWGGTMRVVATVRNDGAGNAPATNARIILAPYGEDPFGPRGYTIGSVPIPGVPAFQTVAATQEIQLPLNPPTQLANVGKFVVMMVSDADAKADPVVKPINYQGVGVDWTTAMITPKPTPPAAAQLPDLVVTALTTPTIAAWDQTLEMKARVENNGKADAGPFKVRFLLVQSDDPSAPAFVLGDVTVASLKVGATQEVSHALKLPAQVPAGLTAAATSGRIVVRIDPDRTVDDANLGNNRLASLPITLRFDAPITTPPPVVTTTGNTPTNTEPPKQNPPGTEKPTTPPTIPITKRLQLRQRQQAAKAKRAAAMLAAAERRENRLKLFPRPAQARRQAQGKVRILPINASTNRPDQSA